MNYQDDTPGGGSWRYAGEAAGATDNISSFAASMFGDYSTGDLFELVWQGGGGGGTPEQPPVTCLCLSPRFRPTAPALPHVPDVLPSPPSEDEMASWLYAIVIGDSHGGGGQRTSADDSDETPMVMRTMSAGNLEKLPITKGIGTKDTSSDPGERRKTAAGGARRSHHGQTHNLTEKRRRSKIKERLKTLQQLVPGCDKSNHASTLDQTIQYMKSLQHQVQAMSIDPARPATAAYPAVQPQYMPMPPPAAVAPMVLGPPPPMVPFGAMLQFPHYPAAMMVHAAAPPMYPAAAAPRVAVASPGGAKSSNHRHGSSSSSKGKGSSRARQRD
ncbi:hypothetical protein ACP70R_032452 [Stipagrostis hirtigluma subsp. patula]